MTEFKQIIGRGTRVRDDYGKLCFNILDYTGSATRLFADPDFDGDPARDHRGGARTEGGDSHRVDSRDAAGGRQPSRTTATRRSSSRPTDERRKFYFDGGQVEIAAHLVYELDPDGKQLRVVRYTDYTAEKVRTLCPTAPELRAQWADPDAARRDHRSAWPSAASASTSWPRPPSSRTPTPSTCSATWPSMRRCAPAASARSACKTERKDFFDRYGPEARQILDELLEKYAEHGDAQFVLPDVLKVPPISAPRPTW